MDATARDGAGAVPSALVLVGRAVERSALNELLAAAGAGESRALSVWGRAGVGKTALLDDLAERAEGHLVLRVAGVEAEMELAFAALSQLCAPLRGHLHAIPDPQRAAIETVFGERTGPPPDVLLVGLAVLNVLAAAADDRPVLCIVDDTQWIDRASMQVLGVVARRLVAESVVLVFATRDRSDPAVHGVAQLEVAALDDAAARALLAVAVPTAVDERIRNRVIAEAGGNPLALLELTSGLTAAELAGGFGSPSGATSTTQVDERLRGRLDAVPEPERQLLVVAAADPLGDPTLLRRASELLGLVVDDHALDTLTEWVDVGTIVRFRHPLVRSAIYWNASPADRRRAHGALAAATDRARDPDRCAWHRAHATAGWDDDVADELERAAHRARSRGGVAAAGAFLERAVELSSDETARARRALDAAEAQFQAGLTAAARSMLVTALAGPLDELQLARVDLLDAQISYALDHGTDVPALLVKAARRLAPLDVTLSRRTYLDALAAANGVGPLATTSDLRQTAAAAVDAPTSGHPDAADLLLDGIARTIAHGASVGVPTIQRALEAFRSESLTAEEGLRWSSFAAHAALAVFDDAAWHDIARRNVDQVRAAGALTVLPDALYTLASVHLGCGELVEGRLLLDEADELLVAQGRRITPYPRLAHAALTGDEPVALPLIDRIEHDVVRRGEGIGLRVAQWARAMVANGFGRYEDARAAVHDAADHPEELWYSTWAVVELVEAAERAGRPAAAATAVDRLAEIAMASGTDLALGMYARACALVGADEDAERCYVEAVDRLGRTRVRVELARCHLLYGEWLRRQRRRTESRQHLQTAHDLCVDMGLGAFAQRARVELRATGATARKRNADTWAALTPQEAQVARLARDHLTNVEIGARLFISPRTVEYHLRKVFAKLDITARAQLADALADDASLRRRAGGSGALPRGATTRPVDLS